MSPPDRLKELLTQSEVTGIDFIYVFEKQVNLDVYFLRSPIALDKPLTDLKLDKIHININNLTGGELESEVSIIDMKWNGDVLSLTTALPGDFTLYKLFIDDYRIDPYFNDITFSFKANCKSDLDCKLRERECAFEEQVDFPVDYQARDFWSFRRALLDFASQRYPDWEDRLEADAGTMLAEVMSALGDELAYYQDRIAREAYLETATQRRSIRRHARLVDYQIHDGLGASTWLDITVNAGQNVDVKGMNVWSIADSGKCIDYEVGRGLNDTVLYIVNASRNSFQPHIWDEDDTCLAVGTTELFIEGHHKADLPLDDFPDNKPPGKWLLLKKVSKDSAIQERNLLVRIISIENTIDPLNNNSITKIVWDKSQALPFEIDMWENGMNVLEVRGNLVPITAGKRYEKLFVIGIDPVELNLPTAEEKIPSLAIERVGPNGSISYLFSLPGTESNSMVWLGDDPRSAKPEIRLVEVEYDHVNKWIEKHEWIWKPSFLDTNSSQKRDRHFTLDDGTWKQVVKYQRTGEEIIHLDYASNDGFTIRFGDGEFGMIPSEGTVFKVTYRLGGGKQGNIPEGSIKQYEKDYAFIDFITNPRPIKSGLEPETHDVVRKFAPEAFRALTYRAVRPEDYADAAERLEWIQRAGSSFRWTGSWLSAFVTPDPKDSVIFDESRYHLLINQIDRFRQAGRETHVSYPQYANLDFKITICVASDAYCGEVKEMILMALFGKKGVNPSRGYFSPDNFTFATQLERSALEAFIQRVQGVRAVTKICFRRRGWFEWQEFTDLFYNPGKDYVIRVENNPLHPERGTVKLIMEGGA